MRQGAFDGGAKERQKEECKRQKFREKALLVQRIAKGQGVLAGNSFAQDGGVNYGLRMSIREIDEAVMELPEQERLELARRIVASLVTEQEVSEKIAEAVRGIEDVMTGKVAGLSETEFRNALK